MKKIFFLAILLVLGWSCTVGAQKNLNLEKLFENPISSEIFPYGINTHNTNWKEIHERGSGCSFDIQKNNYCNFGTLGVINCSDCSTYCWSTGAKSQTILVNQPGWYSVTVTSIASNCESIAEMFVDKIGVDLNLSISGPDKVCSGGNINLIANANEPVSYKWGNGSMTQSINVTSPGTYYLTVTNSSGCTNTADFTVSQGTKPAPPSITMEKEGEGVRLTSTLASQYFWSNGSQSQSVLVNENGFHKISLFIKNSLGCTSDNSAENGVFINKCNETPKLPNADFGYAKNNLEVEFFNQSEFSTHYLWEFGDDKISNEKNPIHTYNMSGDYIVSLTAFSSLGSKKISKTINVTMASGGNNGNLICDTTQITSSIDLDYGGYVMEGMIFGSTQLFPPVKDSINNFDYKWSEGSSGPGKSVYIQTPATLPGWHKFRLLITSKKTSAMECYEFKYEVRTPHGGDITSTDESENRERGVKIYPTLIEEDFHLQFPAVSPGLYFLNIINQNGILIETKKIIKQ